MAELSRFFNSVAGDERTYQANDFAQFFSNFLGNGFFEGLAVTSENTMNTIIAPGSAFIEGHEYTNTTSLTLLHDAADASLGRIDRIVLRLDRDIDVRNIKAFVKKGTAATNPVPPALTRNSYVHELSLAQVHITAGKSFIEATQIIDERGDNDVCGRVQVARKVGDQITTVDVKPVTAKPEEFSEGISQFYLSGSGHADIMQGWLDSIGISPSDYGRSLSSLRAYVHTIGNRTNTGVQTITIFDWALGNDYKIYGEYKRANNAISDTVDWGEWQEVVMVVEKGQNENGEYVRYSDGRQICSVRGASLNLGDMQATGNIFRSPTSSWEFPSPFIDDQIIISGTVNSYVRWFNTGGPPSTTSVSVVQFGSTDGPSYTMNIMATGRWR